MAQRIIIAASGSGGHLIPALHIARALRVSAPDAKIEFVGTGRPLEEKLVAPEFPLHRVAAARVMQQGVRGLLKLLIAAPRAIRQLKEIFGAHPPDVVVGVGGYASVFPVLYAAARRIPCLIHEAERSPGLANRLLGPLVDVVSVARPECRIFGTRRRVNVGQPMRSGLSSIAQVHDVPRSLLVLGGSQGAAALDTAAAQLGSVLARFGMTVTHQTRADGMERVREAYRGVGVNTPTVLDFIDDMRETYERSDVVISRAGANSVRELEVIGRPVIFVPYPHAQGGHQEENAQSLCQQGRAVMCFEGENFGERLRTELELLVQRGENGEASGAYQAMQRAPHATRDERAAIEIATEILRLARERRSA